MELNVGQKLFEAIQAVTGHTPLESDMYQILSAIEEDNNLKNIDDLHGVSDNDDLISRSKLLEQIKTSRKYYEGIKRFDYSAGFHKSEYLIRKFGKPFLLLCSDR